MTDRITKEQRSRLMARIRSKNTKPEKIMFKLLRENGVRFRKHSKLPGKPDVSIPGHSVAIFVDGEFWHGKDYNEWAGKLNDFWRRKISSNMKRDRRNDRQLRNMGWHVLHVWGKSIQRNPEAVLRRLKRLMGPELSH